MIRTSWVGQDIVFEEELGGFRINLQWTRQTALIARIDGVPQLFLERRTIALGAAGVIYVHLPTDGHDSIRVVAGELLAGNDRPRTLADHVVGPLLWLVSLPLSLAFLTFFLGMFAFLATSLSGAWFGWPTPLAEPGVEMMVLFGILFFGSLLHLALTWALSRWLGEPVGATIARQRLGVPDHLQPMGTWQGVLSKSGWAKRQLTVWLQVMTAVGARRWLVMMRTHRSASSARVALFATPADQVPGLLRALDAFRDLPPAVAE